MRTFNSSEDIPNNVIIYKYHNCFRIYPYYKSKYNKETRTVEGTCPKLDNMYLYFDQFKGFINKKDILSCYDKKTKTLSLPIGFGLETIESKLYDNGIVYEVRDYSDKIVQSRDVNYELNPEFELRNKYQAESVEFLTSDKLFYSKLLALSTGIGKTICSVFAAYRLKKPMLIVSETLVNQWEEKISEYTDCNKNNKGIVIIRGTEKIQHMLNWPDDKFKSAFYITTSSTLSSYLDKFGTLNTLYEKLGIGIMCFDEYHMNWAQNVRIERDCQVERVWRLTATPSRTNSGEKRIFDRMLKDIPVYGLATFSVNNYSTVRLVDYDTKPTDYEVGSCMTMKGLSAVNYWNYIFDNDNRKLYMLGMIKSLLDPLIDEQPDSKVLIYLAKLEHIDVFKKLLENLYEKEKKFIDFGNYTTEIANKKLRKRELRNRVIFTTIGSGGVGLDVDNLVAVFSLVPFSSPITASQAIGRLRFIPDAETYFYDFIDTGFKSMQRQRMSRMQTFVPKSKKVVRKVITYEAVMDYIKEII